MMRPKSNEDTVNTSHTDHDEDMLENISI